VLTHLRDPVQFSTDMHRDPDREFPGPDRFSARSVRFSNGRHYSGYRRVRRGNNELDMLSLGELTNHHPRYQTALELLKWKPFPTGTSELRSIAKTNENCG